MGGEGERREKLFGGFQTERRKIVGGGGRKRRRKEGCVGQEKGEWRRSGSVGKGSGGKTDEDG